MCASQLPSPPKPVFQLHPNAKILIAGQAPGRIAHDTGIPFNDASRQRLGAWLGCGCAEFYDAEKFAILPMGLCYPGSDKTGDLPPRPECATYWRQRLSAYLPNIQLTLLIGQYAQNWHLGNGRHGTLTETVTNWREVWPEQLPLPHPSPRNNRWLKQNPWFEAEVVPLLKGKVSEILS